jgi:hypothetical protein
VKDKFLRDASEERYDNNLPLAPVCEGHEGGHVSLASVTPHRAWQKSIRID